MSWVLAFAGFAALVIFHELGHFAAAKAVGMRVERFSLFFPPILAKVRRGETEYCIGAVPLGGYVRITGMNPHEAIPEEVAHRAYFRQSVWKRIVVIAAGPAVNIVLAIVLISGLYMVEDVVRTTNAVDAVAVGSPAERELRAGDVLLAVDGVRGDPQRMRDQIGTHECAGRQVDRCLAATPARLLVRRAGVERTVTVAPRYDAKAKRPLVGFTFGARQESLGVGEAIEAGLTVNWEVATGTVSAITRLFYDSKARDEVSGVVGSYEVTRQSFEFDTAQAMRVLALISLSLAVVNLFPFLPLDGGHIFWALAEKLRGRPIPFRVLERVSVFGFLLVIVLFAIGLSNDIERLSGEGFGVR